MDDDKYKSFLPSKNLFIHYFIYSLQLCHIFTATLVVKAHIKVKDHGIYFMLVIVLLLHCIIDVQTPGEFDSNDHFIASLRTPKQRYP